MDMSLFCGVDVGSVAVKLVLLTPEREVFKSYYRRSHGQSTQTLQKIFSELRRDYPNLELRGIGTTGSGGKHLAQMLNCEFVNEIVALTKANGELLPEVNTVIEMGGEDSKLLLVRREQGAVSIEDFAMNALCAAGTGSFLDQQAGRLGISIEKEFGELALKSERPPRIAGRCSVFAKSDMIHLQQIATPDYDIVAGLCYAVARNFKSTIARGKKFLPPIAFEGGVAANKGMIRAFEDILELQPGELIVPEHHNLMSAIGVALYLLETTSTPVRLDALQLERRTVKPTKAARKLVYSNPDSKHYDETTAEQRQLPGVVDGYLGVDVGSLSTNVVVIDEDGNVLSRRYLMTEGRPLEAVRKAIGEVGEEVGDHVRIKGCGSTGSGRYLVGDFLGADMIRNEITAQATAAIFIDPDVDTIFEIGGQDSKYIAIDHGVVVDFEMNKACAAGTGSFLQEQAEKLNIRIEEEFGSRALSASCPVGCGERCTVFMESDLVSHQQAGASKDDLVAGLAYSIVKNYLTRVVCGRRIGKKVFFQGGVAWNKGVVAAFEMVTGQKVTVPPHHDVTGAIGAALLARNAGIEKSQFKGWDIWKRHYEVKSFVCEDCPNMCEIREVAIEGEDSLYYGSRCEKYDSQGRQRDTGVPDLFRSREKLLFGTMRKPKPHARNQIRIGIPRTTLMYELLPFWSNFFTSLGFRVALSGATSARIVEEGIESSGAETCFPIKLAYGHVLNLARRNVDYIFVPSIIKIKDEGAGEFGDFVCPYIQSLPYSIQAGIDFAPDAPPLLTVPVHLRFERQEMERELAPLRAQLGVSRSELGQAIQAAIDAQREFQRQMQLIGAEVLENLPADQPSLVVISRPYNGSDAKLSLEIPKRIRELGALAIPIDMLPQQRDESEYDDNMYWKYGRRILDTCAQIESTPNLYALYITNFGCGPDSFITHFFKEKMNGKPYLQIEVDEHSADAGVITRIEAFLDSLQGGGAEPATKKVAHVGAGKVRSKVYIPQMCDHAFAFAAALRACGGDAEALPATTAETMEQGRKYTSGKECFPCILTTGDIMAKINSPDFDRDRSAFLMPSASGPCRFGQYNRFQRMILDHNGYEDIPIISPDSRDSYRDLGCVDDPGRMRKLGWQGMVATDVLYKIRCRIKPYEEEPGQTESVYQKSLEILSEKLEEQADLADVIHVCAQMFDEIPRDDATRKPLIGVVGEIYLRQNAFANNSLVEVLESMGVEVRLAPMIEWVFYTNFTYKKRLFKERKFIELGKAILTDLYQRRIEHRLMSAALKVMPLDHDLPMEKLLELAYPYLHVSFSGEAILSIGKAIEYYHHGARGIINAMPFACMPGTIVGALSKKVRQDFDNLPWLNMSYEGLTGANEYTRLEAFVYQAERFEPAGVAH